MAWTENVLFLEKLAISAIYQRKIVYLQTENTAKESTKHQS
jgi:hypothetical protein